MQSAINMHLSQIAHGKLSVYNINHVGELAMFLPDDDNAIVVGYTPSMIKVNVLTDAGAILARFHWYDWDLDNMWDETATTMVDSFVALTERGFVIDGVALGVLHATGAQVVWETYGCMNDGSYRAVMNPAAVAGDTAMPPIPASVDEPDPIVPLLSSNTDIQENSVEPDYVTAIDNDTLAVTVAADTTADGLISELEATDGSDQTYNIYADDTGAPDLSDEKTLTDVLVTTDWLVVTAEDGTTANYEITVESGT